MILSCLFYTFKSANALILRDMFYKVTNNCKLSRPFEC